MKTLLFLVVLALVTACASASTPTPTLPPGTPAWVSQRISDYMSQPVQNPPAAIYRTEYQGQTVYYIPSPCCDQYNFLYDSQGQVICAPDGGLTGRGDGKCPDFAQQQKNRQLLWQDARAK